MKRHHFFESLLVVFLFIAGVTLLAIGTEPRAILLGLVLLISTLILTAYIVRKKITNIALHEIEEAWEDRRKSENTLRKEFDSTHRTFVETRNEFINLMHRHDILRNKYESTRLILLNEMSRRSEIEQRYNELKERDIIHKIDECNDLLKKLSTETDSASQIDYYKKRLEELQDQYSKTNNLLDKLADEIHENYSKKIRTIAEGVSTQFMTEPFFDLSGGDIGHAWHGQVDLSHRPSASQRPSANLRPRANQLPSASLRPRESQPPSASQRPRESQPPSASPILLAEGKTLFDLGKLFLSHILLDRKSHRVKMSRVDFSAVAPKSFPLGRVSIVDLFLYENNARRIVDEILCNKENTVETKAGEMIVNEGAKVRVVVASPDISLNYSEERTWNGNYLHFTVPVKMPITYHDSQILFEAEIYVGGIRASGLSMTADCSAPAMQLLSIIRNDIRTAFASYSRKNQKQVFAAVQAMRKCLPDLDIFVDKEELKSGEYWKEKLMREIEKRDVLYLFWSQAASESSWVEREWRYAYNVKGLNGIDPFPLEKIPPCPSPPNELKDKNFTDVLINML